LSESGDAAPVGQDGEFVREGKEFASHPLGDTRSSSAGLTDWDEIGIELLGRALVLAGGCEPNRGSTPAAEARVTRIIRWIDDHPESDHRLNVLAREAKLSRYHFLRVFQQLAGLTPHQYILRTRLRRAATQLALEPHRVVDIALDSGYGDVSNF